MFRPFVAAVCVGVALAVAVAPLRAEVPMRSSAAPARVDAALATVRAWLGDGENGRKWDSFLSHDGLRAAVESSRRDPNGAFDREAVARSWAAYAGPAAGLENRRFRAVRDALADWIADPAWSSDAELAEVIGSNAPGYVPVTRSAVDAARREAAEAVARLERYLAPGGENGARWAKYLGLDELRPQLTAETVDVAVLDEAIAKLRSGKVGLELGVFAEPAAALGRFAAVVDEYQNASGDAESRRLVAGLAESLAGHAKAGSTVDLQDAAETASELERRGQLGGMTAALRRRYSKPNLFVEVDEAFAAALASRPVDEVRPVGENILGTNVRGTGRTIGRATVDFIPSNERAAIDLVFNAVNHSTTVGVNGPAVIHARGTTQLRARRRLWISADGISTGAPTASATAESTICGIGSTKPGLVGRIVQRVATKKAAEQKPAANAEAGRKAGVRVAAQFEEQTGPLLAQASGRFLDRFRRPLERRGEFPEQFQLSTTEDRLLAVARHEAAFRYGAGSSPPAAEFGGGASVRVHETLVNNSAAVALAGLTLDQDSLREKIKELTGRLPEAMVDAEDQRPFSVTLDDFEPVTIRFGEDRVEVTISGSAFSSGERKFGAMEITARYGVKLDGGRLVAERAGELEIFPPGFDRSRSLPLRFIVQRDLLRRKFGLVFKERIQVDEIRLPGELERAGPLQFAQVDAERGWLVLGVREPGRAMSGGPVASGSTVTNGGVMISD